MIVRPILLAVAVLAVTATTAFAQSSEDVIAVPVLRANVTVAGDIVRIGDVIDNAGTAAQIAIYRAPDLGTTGSLPTALVLAALQAHQVIGVDTKDIKTIAVTRLSRTIEAKEIQTQLAHALEHRGGLGDAANLVLTFDREVQDIQLEASNSGATCSRSRSGSSHATAASTSASRSATTSTPRRQNCALPAPRSKPSKPPC